MPSFFSIVFAAVVAQRLLELVIARRNAAFLLSRGGYEVGAEHYKYIVALHISFLLSLFAEVWWLNRPLSPFWPIPFSLFASVQPIRYWCIRSLGRFWNTRIIILPGATRVVRGPYRLMRHPNYWVVGIELLALPLTFSAYFTALLFSFANLWLLLRVRIPVEEASLAALQKPER